MPNQVVHFEIPADDVARAKSFYEKTFGWKIKQFPMPPGDEYWGITAKKGAEPGINGGLMKRKMPGQPFTNYIGVKSIDAMHETVQANGGVVVLPKQEIGPNMGWISAFTDPEGNLIGLHQAPAAMRGGTKNKGTKGTKKSTRKVSTKRTKKNAKKKRR
jgi:predicted enzyme related to lactoylglutathione lyase